jgi:hypothetical protein
MSGKKRDRRSTDAPSKPTPMELIRFCKEVGIDLFGGDLLQRIAQTKARDYSTLVRDWLNPSAGADSVEDKLRLALNLWTDVGQIAANVIKEGNPPSDFRKDARMDFRWRTSNKLHIPQRVKDKAALLWEHAFAEHDADILWDTGGEKSLEVASLEQMGAPRRKRRQITGAEALRVAAKFKQEHKLHAAPDIRTEGGMCEAFQAFGCPEKLMSCLTELAVEQLISLGNNWVKAQNKRRSADQRWRKKEKVAPLKKPLSN